ncbi:MAG: CRTAC1 family protein [Verrucomicrobiales bacterium]|nr:CRTAC1 family protein [Verrucomicrobiales bacterium]
MTQVRNGASWSGSERNCCFLNVAGGRFVNVSSLSGIDFDDDGRAMAVCDWDRDGDQDIWLRNRSAPRVRLMANQSSGAQSVYVRLEGVECNRDGIGAVVEIEGRENSLIRSVRAGEMFLSQSSKWLHFGLGPSKKAVDFMVYWPGGGTERFHGAKPGGRYLLRQGEGRARAAVEPDRQQKTAIGKQIEAFKKLRPMEGRGPSSNSGILLPVPVPLPALSVRDPAAQSRRLAVKGEATLLVLWDSGSKASLRVLSELQRARVEMSSSGIRVVALALNGIDNAGDAYDAIEKCEFGWEWGFVGEESREAIFRWQEALFDRSPGREVPFMLLLNKAGDCVAIYRAGMKLIEVLDTARDWLGIDRMARWHLAPPMGGTWFTNPVEDQYVRRIVNGVSVKENR